MLLQRSIYRNDRPRLPPHPPSRNPWVRQNTAPFRPHLSLTTESLVASAKTSVIPVCASLRTQVARYRLFVVIGPFLPSYNAALVTN